MQAEAGGAEVSDGPLKAQKPNGRQRVGQPRAPEPLQHLGPQSHTFDISGSDHPECECTKTHTGRKAEPSASPPCQGAGLVWQLLAGQEPQCR